ARPQSPQTPPFVSSSHKTNNYSPLRLEHNVNGDSNYEEDPVNDENTVIAEDIPLTPSFSPEKRSKAPDGDINSGIGPFTGDRRQIKEADEGRILAQPIHSHKHSVSMGARTPPGRRSVQFARSPLNIDPNGSTHIRSSSWDMLDGEGSSKDRRGGTLLTKLRAFANSSSGQSHSRSPSGFTLGGDSTDERPVRAQFSSGMGGEEQNISPQPDSEIDADAEQSTGEGDSREIPMRKRKRKSRRPQDGELQTAPTTPKTALPRTGRPSFFASASSTPSERFRPSFLPRRATMTDLPSDSRQGVSEDEGRDRMNNAWRRGSAWVHSRRSDQQTPAEPRRPTTIRRFTGFATPNGDPDVGPFSPWKSLRDGRTSTVSAAKWRQLKAGLKMIGQRRKAENTVDHAKSAELLAELTAGVPAALILASMFQRDEHGNKRIPVLLEQLKVRVTDSHQLDTKSGDRHVIFRIELEYGNGLTRMKWVIHRALRDFANLHARYKLQIGAQKYIQLKPDEARTKLPHFPRSTFPYLRGIRGLDSDSEEEDEPGDFGGSSGH
ncbi:MAG: hypothetical protein Q9214_007281, partial [Letrouitia sp. 1 TL-2023]